ncbi:MAG: DNA-binding response regulator [Bacteroidia bacterium]|nr:MAG: DNA-binding response regulator [Bacteroidia bacterium]
MSKILLVEDEEHLRDVIRLNLELEGHNVQDCNNGALAIQFINKVDYELFILDVMLPEINGFDICQYIRDKKITAPILFLTAKNEPADRIKGLKLGADDYLAKPFNLEELLLRVNILLKRNKDSANSLEYFEFDGMSINFKTFEIVDKNGEKRQISKREAQLLELLIKMRGQVVSRDLILERLWKDEELPTARTIDNYILNFRKYFEGNSKESRYIHSVRGVGYKFITH